MKNASLLIFLFDEPTRNIVIDCIVFFPLRIEDLNWEGLEVCYLLDFFGPNGFATSLAMHIPQ